MGLLSTAKMYMSRGPEQLDEPTDLYAHQIGLLEGGTLDLQTLRGNPTLFVNTASKCGFTPQFEGLQRLYDATTSAACRSSGRRRATSTTRSSTTPSEIGAFCQRNYGVTFTMTEKVSVRAEPHPLWADLARQPDSGPPAWNFTKYLVGADGTLSPAGRPRSSPRTRRSRRRSSPHWADAAPDPA